MLTFSGCFTRRGDALEVLHRPQANEEIEHLPQRDVERTNAAADRSRQRTFDADEIFAERFDRVVRQPFIEFVLRCLAGENFEPRDLFSAAVRFFDRGIEHAHARGPDVRPGAVAANKWNDRMIRHIQFIGSGNFFACGRSDIFVWHKGQTVEAAVLSRNRGQSSAACRLWSFEEDRKRELDRNRNYENCRRFCANVSDEFDGCACAWVLTKRMRFSRQNATWPPLNSRVTPTASHKA